MQRSVKTQVGWLAIFATAPVLMGLTCPCCPWSGPPGGGAESSLELLEQAARRARERDPDAIVFSVQGRYGSTIPGPSLTLEYTFLALDPDDPQSATWTLYYDRTQWTVQQADSPFLGVAYHDLTQVDMSFEQARTRLLNAGYTNDFHGWSLHKPLFGNPNPIFGFNYGTCHVTVDTVTGQVRQTSGDALAATPGDDSVSIRKIIQATAEIRKTDPDAIIIWAGGRDGEGRPLNTAAQTNVWDFYAVNREAQTVQAWSMTYDGDWQIAELQVPPFGIEFWDIRQIDMDVVEAWTLAENAGYDPPFNWWTVFKPLNAAQTNPVVVFGSTVGRIVVDTVTGEVTVE